MSERRKTAVRVLLVIFALLAIAVIWRTVQGGQEQAVDEVAPQADGSEPDYSAKTLEADKTSVSEPSVAATGLGRPVNAADCPIPVAAVESVYYSQGANIETWKYVSDRTSRDLASELLVALRDQGYELIKADFLDLYGNAWGCTVKSPDGESFVIAMLPQRLGASAGSDNKTKVSIVHIFIPNIDVEPDGVSK